MIVNPPSDTDAKASLSDVDLGSLGNRLPTWAINTKTADAPRDTEL